MTTRSRPHVYLRLARVSNLPTVWTNVLAGGVIGGGQLAWTPLLRIGLGVSLLYTAGMFLNDAFDRTYDAAANPRRPIPAREVAAREVFGVGWVLLVAGLLVVIADAWSWPTIASASTLAAAIVYYDYRHKRDPLGPAIMALCRSLVYFVAAAATASISVDVIAAALLLFGYVLLLTWISKRAGPHAGWLIAVLIAGISLLDAILIAVAGRPDVAVVAACGFPLTLLAQRWVSGV